MAKTSIIMVKDKIVLVTIGCIDHGKTTMTETIASLKEEHPNLIVVHNPEDAKKLAFDLEPEKDRGIIINVPEKPFPVEEFKQNAIQAKYHEFMPEIKITHKGEQVKSARNIRREKERKQKKCKVASRKFWP